MSYSGVASLLQSFVVRLQYYLTRATANTAAASIIWLVGAWATGQCLTELGISGPTQLGAFVVQGLLTVLEGPVWHKHLRHGRGGATIIGIGALGIDLMLNIGGLWVYLQNLGVTTFWSAIMAATNQSSAPAPLTCFALTLLISLCVAAGPEALWDL